MWVPSDNGALAAASCSVLHACSCFAVAAVGLQEWPRAECAERDALFIMDIHAIEQISVHVPKEVATL